MYYIVMNVNCKLLEYINVNFEKLNFFENSNLLKK